MPATHAARPPPPSLCAHRSDHDVSPLTSRPSSSQIPAVALAASRGAAPRALGADAAGDDDAAPQTPSAERRRRRTHTCCAKAAGARRGAKHGAAAVPPLPPAPPRGASRLRTMPPSSSSDFVQAERGTRSSASPAPAAAVPRGARSATRTMSGSSDDASAPWQHSRSIIAPQGSGVVSIGAVVEGEARHRALLSPPPPQGSDCDVVVVKAAARVDAAPAPPAASSPVASLSGRGDGPRSTAAVRPTEAFLRLGVEKKKVSFSVSLFRYGKINFCHTCMTEFSQI